MKKLVYSVLMVVGLMMIQPVFAQVNSQEQNRDSQWLMQLRPGMTLSAYWFLWSASANAITINAQLENPTPWISEIILDDTTSTSCSDINTMRLNVVAPTEPGVYTARILDLNFNYEPINIILLVSDVLIAVDSLDLNAVVNEELVIPEPRINDGKSNLGCVDPYYPSTSESYEFFWLTGGIPGSITTTPSEFTLQNEEQIILQNSAIFTQAGNYTAYRLGKVEFSSALWVLKVNFTVTESTLGLGQNSLNTNKMLYPNPTTDFIHIPSRLPIYIRSVDGKLVKVIQPITTNTESKIDISDLIPGIYLAQTGNQTFKIIKQ